MISRGLLLSKETSVYYHTMYVRGGYKTDTVVTRELKG